MAAGLLGRLAAGPSGLESVLDRLRRGSGPPLRLSEFAIAIGYSVPTVKKLIREGEIQTVGLTDERRIPMCEAIRVARDLKILKE
jgi:hypothetical protein